MKTCNTITAQARLAGNGSPVARPAWRGGWVFVSSHDSVIMRDMHLVIFLTKEAGR